MHVPFLDLPSHIKPFQKDLERAFHKSLENASFVMGHEVEEFEKKFARYCGAKYCVAVNSGTAALHVALLAHGIGPGDEVMTQPNTFIATAEAISYAGAKPVFVDVDEKTAQMRIEQIERVITKRTKAIIPVHLFGSAANLPALRAIARKHRITIIEDACQAHGVRYNGKRIGGWGNTTCFSFYPSKVLGTIGEGGAIVTSDKKLWKKMYMLRNHGQQNKNAHEIIGYNWRMQELQGTALGMMLPHSEAWVRARRKLGMLYGKLLADMHPHVVPMEIPSSIKPNFYVYLIRCQKRDALMRFLAQHGIGTQIYYPTPIHLQGAYREKKHHLGAFPAAEQLARASLALPIYPELRDAQVRYVVATIKKFYEATTME